MIFSRAVCLLKISFLSFIFTFNTTASCDEMKVIEWRYSREPGLFSLLSRVTEWIYCVRENENFGLYLNFQGAYGYNGDAFPVLFKPFEDPLIATYPMTDSIWCATTEFVKDLTSFKKYPTDGMRYFKDSKWIYMNSTLYKDPDFSIFRNRIHPVISQYLQPAADLQERIDIIMQEMNRPVVGFNFINSNTPPQRTIKIGIHVRSAIHYQWYNKSPDQFLDDVERDIDRMMRSRKFYPTKIFLATLVEQLVERLSAKYNVVACDIPRSSDLMMDWAAIENPDPMDMARDAIVDTWCLANCDELWGTSSNMVIFAACINPNLIIRMIPCLENYSGK